MREHYVDTVSLCPQCAADSPAYYEEDRYGIYLVVDCAEHGRFREQVERDKEFFKTAYEHTYQRPVPHIAIPVTYRCNLKCRYCYTLSNNSFYQPADRPAAQLIEWRRRFKGNVTLIGGEPTVRRDLITLIKQAKDNQPRNKVSIATNGQKLKDIVYLNSLLEAGLDFVFLSLNDVDFEESLEIYQNKLTALANCQELKVPVWLQRSIDDLSQLDSLYKVLESWGKVIFKVTIRSVQRFGAAQPWRRIFVSEMLAYLKKSDDFIFGGTPFNRYINLLNKPVKVCAWVNDVKRLSNLDSAYVVSDGTLTTLHRGMRLDECLIMKTAAADFKPVSN